MIKGLLFDLDGVITDTAIYHYKAWKKLTDELEIPFDEQVNELLKGISREQSLQVILREAKVEGKYSEALLGEFLERKNGYYIEMIGKVTERDILPGIGEILEQAREQGLKLALASASKNAPFLLERLNLTEYFHAIVDPATLRQGKPDPEIFLKAAEKINCLPRECIGFEDAQAGIEALVAANIFSVGIGDKELLGDADIIYSGTSELNLKHILQLAIKHISR